MRSIARVVLASAVLSVSACSGPTAPTMTLDPAKAPYLSWSQAADNLSLYRFEMLVGDTDRRRVDVGCWLTLGSPDAMCATALPPMEQSWLRMIAIRTENGVSIPSLPSAPIPSVLLPIDGLRPLAQSSGESSVHAPHDLQIVAAGTLPRRP